MAMDWRARGLFASWTAAVLVAAVAVVWPWLKVPLLGLLGLVCVAPVVVAGLRVHSLFQLSLGLILFAYVLIPLADPLFPDSALVEEAVLFMTGFVGALIFGYALPAGRSVARELPAPHPEWSAPLMRASVLVLSIGGVAGFIGLLLMLGVGLGDFYATSHQLRMYIASTGGLYFYRNLVIWMIWAAFWLPVISILLRSEPAGRLERARLVLVFVLLVVVVSGFGQRFYLFFPFLSLLLLVSLLGRRIAVYAALVLAPFVVLISGAYSFYRQISFFERASIGTIWAAVSSMSLSELLSHGAAVSGEKLSMFILVLEHWDYGRADFLGGQSLLNLIWLFVPRSLIGAKPLYTDSYLTELLIPYGNAGFAFGTVSEMYINFGLAGLLASGALFGVLLRVLDTYLELHRHNPSVLLWFATVATFVPFAVVGGLYTVTTIEIVFFSLLSAGMAALLAFGARSARPTRVRGAAPAPIA